MPTMLSGRLFQILTARYIKLLPEEYDLDFGSSRARLGIYSGLRRLLVLGGRVEETWFSNQRAQTGMHPIQDCHSCNLPPLIKRRNEYLRLPFKVKVDYFILNSILVSSFVIFLLLFCYEQKKTHLRSAWVLN